MQKFSCIGIFLLSEMAKYFIEAAPQTHVIWPNKHCSIYITSTHTIQEYIGVSELKLQLLVIYVV